MRAAASIVNNERRATGRPPQAQSETEYEPQEEPQARPLPNLKSPSIAPSINGDIAPARRIGENGQALLLKIAINFSLLVQMTAFSEGLLLAERAGIDREIAVGAMLDSVAASPMLKYRAPLVLEQPEEAWFDCNMMQKDMNLALEAGREYGVPMLTAGVTNELMTAARGMGLDHRDFSIVYDVLAAMAGRKGTVA